MSEKHVWRKWIYFLLSDFFFLNQKKFVKNRFFPTFNFLLDFNFHFVNSSIRNLLFRNSKFLQIKIIWNEYKWEISIHLPNSFGFDHSMNLYQISRYYLMNNINLGRLIGLYAIVECKLLPILMYLIWIILYQPVPTVILFSDDKMHWTKLAFVLVHVHLLHFFARALYFVGFSSLFSIEFYC